MKVRALKNTPLRPLADRARKLAEASDELWVATAFASHLAVEDVVGSAVRADTAVRFLTGTFGKVTRRRTFERLARWAGSGEISARVWDGDYHANLLIFRKGPSATAWVGSANMTNRGLQNEGELVMELTGKWNDAAFRSLRRAFNEDWRRSAVLDDTFVRSYREAPRVGHLLAGGRREGPASKRRSRTRVAVGSALLVVPVGVHYPDSSPTARRVTARLGGAEAWYRSRSSPLRAVREGKLALLADGLDRTLSVVIVTDRIRDEGCWVFSHRPFTRLADPRMTGRLRRDLSQLGLSLTTKAFRAQWLDRETAEAVVQRLYGPAAARRLQKMLG